MPTPEHHEGRQRPPTGGNEPVTGDRAGGGQVGGAQVGGQKPGAARLSALPSVRARVLAFAAILVAGVCGGLIGGSLVSLQCQGGCAAASSIGALVGALVAAGGVAVVAALTLRAMGEWKRVREEDLFNNPG